MSFLTVSISALLLASTPAELELRAQQQPPPGRIVELTPGGVLLAPVETEPEENAEPVAATSRDPTLIIGWDRVRRVRGDFAGAADEYMSVAQRAWRARIRLERGDAFAAEPLFDQLYSEYRDTLVESGPTGAVIAEGLLRCRLRRGAHIAAIDPWIALLQVRTPLPTLNADWALKAELPPVLDESTRLIPALPPMWLPWPAVEAFARSGPSILDEETEQITNTAQALAALYIHAARFEVGIDSELPQIRTSDRGVQLVRTIVQARTGDREQRQRARQQLREQIRTRSTGNASPLWMEVWCRAALGRSLIREPSVELQKQGVLELLHLPARFADSHPYLTGLALAEAAATLRDMGDDRSADILARQLAEEYPTHPVHDWRRVQAYPSTPPLTMAGPRTRVDNNHSERR